MTEEQPALASQSIYAKNGTRIYWGYWDPRAMFAFMSLDGESWSGRRVLDVASNTSGLSIEIARRGASVIALEPDPYKNTIAKARDIVDSIIREESLDITLENAEVFDAHNYGEFDVIVCFGLIYHLRYPQYLLDYLSAIGTQTLFISTQTHQGDELVLYNRRGPSIVKAGQIPEHIVLSGWHPTRQLFKKMLEWAGFTDVVSLTDQEYNFPKRQEGLTNSSYFRARQVERIDLEKVKREFYPR